MKYVVDDLSLETATKALEDNQFGMHTAADDRGVVYVVIWTMNDFEGSGEPGGYIVGSLARNIGTFSTYTLTLDEFHNDNERIAAVLTNVLRRKSMR